MKKISDNPKFKKILKEMKAVEDFTRLQELGVPLGLSPDVLKQCSSKIRGTKESLNYIDRFNDHFAERGWIVYESLNMDVIKTAVDFADQNKFKKAEELLVDHYNDETIRFGLMFLSGLKAFWPRERLANLAKEDYIAERYHACIPVLLMLIDGIVSDIVQKSFFAEGVEVEAWDSIAGHSTGLKKIAGIMKKVRRKTTTDSIALPYRNGIIHGRDLGYDNKNVAAKCWNILFAVRDWAIAVRDGRKGPPPPESEPSLEDQLEQLAQAQAKYAQARELRQRLDAWVPRSVEELAALPRAGAPEEYGLNSPESTLVLLLTRWMKKNYGDMAKNLWLVGDEGIGKAAGRLREILRDIHLEKFELDKIDDIAAGITAIATKCSFTNGEDRELIFRVIFIDQSGDPAPRMGVGCWKVVENSFTMLD